MKFLQSFYLHRHFFWGLLILATLFIMSFWWHALYGPIWILVFLFVLIVLADGVALYRNSSFLAMRHLPKKFSNGDENPVNLKFVNSYGFPVFVEVIDEIPVQFQKRDFSINFRISGQSESRFNYTLLPVKRGTYTFGKLNVYVSTPLRLIKRRYSFQNEQELKVYPSIIQMKKYEFLAMDNKLTAFGLKKIRRIGHTMEFEQIKDYVRGDDIRNLNWKATAKHGTMMVNQYQDERAQPIYSIINTGRVMKMPFEELSLLDYAINSTLAFSNIALRRKDKVGLLSYSHKIDDFLPASNKFAYLHKILETLYQVETDFLDSDIGLLHAHLKRRVRQRSLILFYTNFEHRASLKRQLPFLKAIAKKHLLVVIFFENTELLDLIEKEPEKLYEIYDQTIARQFKEDKHRMVKELHKNGIQTILTPPKKLTVNTINKYLELKSRGLL